MPKPKKRARPLSKAQQREFLTYHIPGRIRSIQAILAGSKLNYLQLAGVAIVARSIAGFLGISTRSGRLCQDHEYFPHDTGLSWEVKLSDIAGGACLKLSDLTTAQRAVLQAGINETNRAFAHLTFWDDPTNQDARGKATSDYVRGQMQRIRKFGEVVIEIYRRHTAGLPTEA